MGMDRIEQMKAYKEQEGVHYNCCQSVLLAFLPECGLTLDTAVAMGAHFGGGMGRGSACGAVTGALMVLGLAGAEQGTANQFLTQFTQRHGAIHCAELLAKAKPANRTEKRAHCDGLIEDSIRLLEELLSKG